MVIMRGENSTSITMTFRNTRCKLDPVGYKPCRPTIVQRATQAAWRVCSICGQFGEHVRKIQNKRASLIDTSCFIAHVDNIIATVLSLLAFNIVYYLSILFGSK